MGISGTTAATYAAKWVELLGGSVDAAKERDRQLMVLAELEQRLVREGVKGVKSWAELTPQIRGVLNDRRVLCGLGGGSGKQVTVELWGRGWRWWGWWGWWDAGCVGWRGRSGHDLRRGRRVAGAEVQAGPAFGGRAGRPVL